MVAGAVAEDVEDYFDHLKLTYKAGFVGKMEVFLGPWHLYFILSPGKETFLLQYHQFFFC